MLVVKWDPMNARLAFRLSAVSHVSSIFAYVPSKVEYLLMWRKGKDNMIWYYIIFFLFRHLNTRGCYLTITEKFAVLLMRPCLASSQQSSMPISFHSTEAQLVYAVYFWFLVGLGPVRKDLGPQQDSVDYHLFIHQVFLATFKLMTLNPLFQERYSTTPEVLDGSLVVFSVWSCSWGCSGCSTFIRGELY